MFNNFLSIFKGETVQHFCPYCCNNKGSKVASTSLWLRVFM